MQVVVECNRDQKNISRKKTRSKEMGVWGLVFGMTQFCAKFLMKSWSMIIDDLKLTGEAPLIKPNMKYKKTSVLFCAFAFFCFYSCISCPRPFDNKQVHTYIVHNIVTMLEDENK
jgi:hypothetical protein